MDSNVVASRAGGGIRITFPFVLKLYDERANPEGVLAGPKVQGTRGRDVMLNRRSTQYYYVFVLFHAKRKARTA